MEYIINPDEEVQAGDPCTSRCIVLNPCQHQVVPLYGVVVLQ